MPGDRRAKTAKRAVFRKRVIVFDMARGSQHVDKVYHDVDMAEEHFVAPIAGRKGFS